MGKEIKCPWCGEKYPEPDIKVSKKKNDYGDLLERRCAKCGKVIATYLEQEGEFFPRIRKF